MQKRPPTPIELSGKEMLMLQQYADSNGMSVDDAATQLASQSLTVNFERRGRKPGTVVQFRKMNK